MGAVLKGRDTDLGRDLAVKVLLEQHRDHPELVRRFVEEAQIGGQLQHPGIVPVYELGTFPDRRPFFAMKLVKGRTLAALLEARRDPADDRPRFLGVFEQVCQTVAYAHARGVIHRDLKPSNVMVGAFGEVQVMDWGLAKVLAAGGAADDERSMQRSDESVIRTVRSGSAADASHAGSVLGTPAYMAPEQARGEIDSLDERADVFGLGAILCEILTGQPPYVGRNSGEVQRLAARADLDDARTRLDACGADPELLALARLCLAAEPRHRPRDAGEVALAMTAYLDGVQERLRRAELARAEAAGPGRRGAQAAAADRGAGRLGARLGPAGRRRLGLDGAPEGRARRDDLPAGQRGTGRGQPEPRTGQPGRGDRLREARRGAAPDRGRGRRRAARPRAGPPGRPGGQGEGPSDDRAARRDPHDGRGQPGSTAGERLLRGGVPRVWHRHRRARPRRGGEADRRAARRDRAGRAPSITGPSSGET